jgi:hypothetical protein
MTSNADLEQRWIDAWNDLYDIVGSRTDVRCMLPDGTVVDVEGCKNWLQEQAYDGWEIAVQELKFDGRLEVAASRSRPDSVHNLHRNAVAGKKRQPR